MLCPACENESTNIQQCTTCEWVFVNFTEEPTEEEQNDYTQLLYSHRSNFYFVLAVQYYDNKQYEEVIECCKISCEHQLFENPLALMASAYLALGNKEEALNFANMSLSINSKNELSISIIAKLNKNSLQQVDPTINQEGIKKIQILTVKILEKNQFEKTQEYEERINSLGYVEIGIVQLLDYDADKELLNFKIGQPLSFGLDTYLNLNYSDFSIKISPSDAKRLYNKGHVSFIAKISISNSIISIDDIKLDQYSFYSEYNTRIQHIRKKELEKETKTNQELNKKKEESIIGTNQELIINYNDSLSWKDLETSLVWEITKTPNSKYTYEQSKTYVVKLNNNNYAGFDDWRIPSVYELSTIYKNICLSSNIGKGSYYRVLSKVFGDHINVFNIHEKNGGEHFTGANNPMHLRCVRGKSKNGIEILDKPSIVSKIIKTKWF